MITILVVCCQSDPLQLSESQRNHYILEVYSANWWDSLKTIMPAADIGQRKGPILHDNARPPVSQQMLQKLNESGYGVLPHLLYSLDLSPTD